MEIPWPTGLQAVVHALNTTINWLEHSPDLLKDNKGISPAPGGGQDYWNTAAESDSAQIMAGARRYQRSERTVSSWVGILLKLIPAWPLLAGLLDIITDWDIGRSVIVSGLGLIALGATELIWHVFSLRRLLERIQRQWKDCLSERVAEILAKTLADYRYQAVGRLRLIASAFDELSDLMLAKYQEIRLKREQSPKRTSQDEGTVYRLIDFRRADEWKSFAIQNANAQFPKHDGAAAGLIAQYALPLLEKPATGRIVLRILEESSEDWARQESRANLPKPYELVSDIKALREGKRWQWLWQRAQLLGDIKKGGKYFTLITLSSDAALEGAYGKNSPYWRADWFVARSRLTHEIGCIRGVIEEP
jgi:hypothetical protein